MINLLAAAVLASTSIVPCATIADHHAAAPVDITMDAIDSEAVEEAYVLAEENFAAHVEELGLEGAAPLFGTQQEAAVEVRSARRTPGARGAKNQRLSAARTPRP